MHVHIARVRGGGLGTIQVATTPQGVARVQLDDDGERMRAELLAQFPEAVFKRPSTMTNDAVRVIRDYLEGGPSPLDVPIVLPEVGFGTRVWKQLARIPYGSARTYGSIARAIRKPRAARAVGGACGRNPLPLLIPCHRVLAADKRLGGFSSGLDAKRFLLKLESIEYSE